jgi:Protein of unknown function (DUF2946)
MRRRYQKFLPLVLIALLLQILAPVAAAWATAAAISDPLGAAEICHADPTSPAAKDGSGADHNKSCGMCWLCGAARTNASFDAPRLPTLAEPYRQRVQVSWRDTPLQLQMLPTGSNARARAPPSIS